MWDVLPKVTIDLGDVSAVTLCINAVTFSSYFRGNVAQAGKKDGYVEDEICHKERNWAGGLCTVAVAHINHRKMWNYHMLSHKTVIYWSCTRKWTWSDLEEEEQSEGGKLRNERGQEERVKGRWVSQRRRNRLLSSFVFFCLSCYIIDQAKIWIDYAVTASVIPFWMNLIFDSVCYSCSWFFAMPFGSTVTVNSSCTVLTVISWMQFWRTGIFSKTGAHIIQFYNCTILFPISHYHSVFWYWNEYTLLGFSFWCPVVESS